MDENAFISTYRELNTRFCPYEKGILTNQCRCPLAQRFNLAEREGVHCTKDHAQAQCVQLLDILREQSRFALKTTRERGVLPHAQAIRIQIGGLRGLQMALDGPESAQERIEDVNGLISQAKEKFDDLQQLPFPLIMQQIAAYQGRRRRSRRDE